MARQFEALFDQWADSYDRSVSGHDEEYRDVFAGYDDILDSVAERARGTVLEFGIGTGNLTKKLMLRGHHVYGIEPSRAMRKIARGKIPHAPVLDGDFLNYPPIEEPIHTIVSTYAFHHLTDNEKKDALRQFSELLPSGGKVIFADTVFETEETRHTVMRKVERQGYVNLLNDLKSEYYPTLDVMTHLFEEQGFQVTFLQLNEFVWLIDAVKQ